MLRPTSGAQNGSRAPQELLYGYRPFGSNQTQEAFRRQTAVEGTFDLETRLSKPLKA